MRDKKTKFKETSRVIGIVIVLFLSVCTFAAMTAAKYIQISNTRDVLPAEEFYFTSTLLDGETHVISGTDKLTITIGNHEDDLRYSSVDIAYEVEVETEDGQYTCSTTKGKLSKDTISDQDIELSGLDAGKTYTVTVTGTSGYRKTLTATFYVSNDDKKIYKYLETSDDGKYVLLTVWSEGYNDSGYDVTITTKAANLIPDNTDSIMRNATLDTNGFTTFTDSTTFIGSITLTDETTKSETTKSIGYTSHTYRFFGDEKTIANVTAEDFDVAYGVGVKAKYKDPTDTD
jgi:hypothetical protein